VLNQSSSGIDPLETPFDESLDLNEPIVAENADPEIVVPEVPLIAARPQSLVLAILGGFVAALIGATVWALFVALTQREIIWVALAVGWFVGLIVRRMGHGTTRVFGLVGAVSAGFSILLGTLLAGVVLASRDRAFPLGIALLALLNPGLWIEVMRVFTPFDWAFIAFAIYQGYTLSFSRVRTRR